MTSAARRPRRGEAWTRRRRPDSRPAMSLADDPDAIARTTRVLQIIVLAMLAGLVAFLVVISFIPIQPQEAAGGAAPAVAERLPVLTVAAFTFAVILGPLSLLVPRLLSDAMVKQI